MRLACLIFTLLIGAIATASQTQAQQPSDWQRGRLLARQVCAECHAVERNQYSSHYSLAPSFTAVARTPGMTAMALNVFLHSSHRYMPNLILSDEQTKGIITYILSLKRS
jgi:mono/diheme cytochrome c family protein